jgi:myosin heavy subunit
LNEYFGYSTEYMPSREHSLQFGVRHFCGDVKYNGHDFLRKNRDILSRNIITCLQESTDNFVEDLFFNLPTPTGSFSNIMTRGELKPFKSFAPGKIEPGVENLSKKIANQLSTKLKSPPPVFVEQSPTVMTQWVQFTTSLSEIISRIEKTKPVFINCIKRGS